MHFIALNDGDTCLLCLSNKLASHIDSIQSHPLPPLLSPTPNVFARSRLGAGCRDSCTDNRVG